MVKPERLARAQEIIRDNGQKLGRDGLLGLLAELGWFDYAHYTKEGKLGLLPMTPEQQVGLAAAMAATVEADGQA